MSKPVTLWVGTRKGAFRIYSKDRKKWKADGPHFRGSEVNHVLADPRNPDRVYAAVNSAWFGAHIHASEDGGTTWKPSEAGFELSGVEEKGDPQNPDAAKEHKPASIKRAWHIEPGHPEEPGVVWLGADPGALFKSTDWGASWKQVNSLTQHPTRDKWFPGAGGMCLHSIQCLGKGRVVAAISAAGTFRSFDGGETWEPHNKGVRADFLPNKYPEVGQCVHKLLAHPRDPEALYQQNHCGVYRGKMSGKRWTDISKGLPSRFGFSIAVPAAEEQTVFTVPMEGAEYRCNPSGALTVARSRDGGKTWKLMRDGLPQKDAHVTVLREAMTSDAHSPAGVYFGTSGGALFATANSGKSWDVISGNLPPVYSVSAA